MRVISPFGGSTLMTRAPMSAMSAQAWGAAMTIAISTTVTPLSGWSSPPSASACSCAMRLRRRAREAAVEAGLGASGELSCEARAASRVVVALMAERGSVGAVCGC